ncbi:DUF1272 domain-containing protein [Thalassomonas actiniarum]|uniref:DUF1272 domain-containing protein n=1 Tax=Thalassomonas actiniarum TaxID=485447 RepID=A0AAF0C6G7_9GAMM|nr:DUF1272 domain-containing protein [Thalassomonas actiniarum]WDE02608.1 DUF1272 domain-containing protein [Thalassomonas actiniarum]
MLEIRPNCEYCDKDLPPDADDAMICTYECTFCQQCVAEILENVCPNCGGGFTPRPIRPKTARRKGVSLAYQQAATKRVHTKFGLDEIKAFSALAKTIDPKAR